ncbi:MAG: hypothetical protein KKA73_12210 [Chloroflexi bacterium]|nr:hypothetical protein [Chloroflexota bacterium]MBU1748445.1 hypothetical protein [Chloroflexota bacterium]
MPELLVHKFLTEYGYTQCPVDDHGPVIARAIVDDILTTIQECSPERVPPQTVVWLAVRRERPGRRKGLDVSDLIPVRLRMVVDEEIQILIDPQHPSTTAYGDFLAYGYSPAHQHAPAHAHGHATTDAHARPN